MHDREMIVKCFEFCRVEDKCSSTDCPYWANSASASECTKELAKDVLTLLKEQDDEARAAYRRGLEAGRTIKLDLTIRNF